MPTNPFLRWLALAYLCRFNLLILLLLLALPFLGLVAVPTLLGGTFELQPGSLFWVPLVAFLTAYSVMNAWQLVRLYGDQRFTVTTAKVPHTPPKSDLKWRHILFFSCCALPVVVTVVMRSRVAQPDELHPKTAYPITWLQHGLYPLGAFVVSLGILYLAQLLCDLLVPPTASGVQILFPKEPAALRRIHDAVRKADLFPDARAALGRVLARVPRQLGVGYINYRTSTILPGQAFAIGLLALTAIMYGIIGWGHCGVALGHVLLLCMIFSWLLSGLAFFFDRYRVPVLLPVLGWMFVMHFFPQCDHFYRSQPRQTLNPIAREIIAAPKPGTTRPPIVVVAANGGGIQSAAWTARVLTGLEEASRADGRLAGRGWGFGESVRMLSSVSGGSVGVLYFVSSYDAQGHLPDQAALERIVALAERSSLDEVSHGLAYSDLGRLFFPMIGDKFADRATALEQQWTRGAPAVTSLLSRWSEDARRGTRPAVIFNATGVESGERVLFGTTDVDGGQSGRENFDQLQPSRDVSALTAARLSATFPYVTPVAIADVADLGANPNPKLCQHVADGGYYDNYGMATLMDWLNEALEQSQEEQPVLVIQILGAPDDPEAKASENRGFFFQLLAPIQTMFSVRSSGQASHNASEFSLLNGKWNERHHYTKEHPFIQNVPFRFCVLNPPLSWHLTYDEKGNIEEEWASPMIQQQCQKVMDFLAGPPRPPSPQTPGVSSP